MKIPRHEGHWNDFQILNHYNGLHKDIYGYIQDRKRRWYALNIFAQDSRRLWGNHESHLLTAQVTAFLQVDIYHWGSGLISGRTNWCFLWSEFLGVIWSSPICIIPLVQSALYDVPNFFSIQESLKYIFSSNDLLPTSGVCSVQSKDVQPVNVRLIFFRNI